MNSNLPHPNSVQGVSDAELELFIDAALAPEAMERVERTIAQSPADAARLDDLRAADDLTRAALLAPAAPVAARRPAPGLRMTLAAAAVLLLAGAVTFLLARGGGTTPAQRPALPVVTHTDAAPEYEPVRVVFSMATQARDPATKGKDKATPAAVDEPTPLFAPGAAAIASAFRDASDAGIRRAVTAINEATPQDRAAALTALGQTLRSGSTAVRILDKLGPRDQVAVCSELALDSALRAVALQRLRDLSDDPDVGADARAAVRTLALIPGMKPWIRSYGLLEPDAPEPSSLEPTSISPATG